MNLAQQILSPIADKVPTLVFLGPPGVGKGTYSSRIARQLGLAHISVGDLIRMEIKAGSGSGNAAAAAVARGDLLSDDLIFELLESRMNLGRRRGEEGYLLDGFPRTAAQAETLTSATDVRVAVNMTLREDVLLQKCLGRRICKGCGANYNIADIDLPATKGFPAVQMPPLLPKESCKDNLCTRPDDNEEVFRRRMQVYRAEAAPVEDVFRRTGLLIDFPVTGGIPETFPNLVKALEPYEFAPRPKSQRQSGLRQSL